MKRYVLNSAVITTEGWYSYRLVTVEEASAWLARGPWQSTIGYAETAEAFGALLLVAIPVDRRQVRMEPGDEALVLRLTERLPDPATKGHVETDWIYSHAEIGILSAFAAIATLPPPSVRP